MLRAPAPLRYDPAPAMFIAALAVCFSLLFIVENFAP